MKSIFVLTAIHFAFATTAEAEYLRFWRGARKPSISQTEFVAALNTRLFPATAALTETSVGLAAYRPIVLPQHLQRRGLPAEVALLTYQAEESYRSYRQTEAGRTYGDLHWEMFDKESSGSVVPEPYYGVPEADHAYEIAPFEAHHPEQILFRALLRPAQYSDAAYREAVRLHIERATEQDHEGYYVLVADNYLLEYVGINSRTLLPQAGLADGYAAVLLAERTISNYGGLDYPLQFNLDTRRTWQRHIDAWNARDLDAIVADYDDDSVVILNDDTYRGTNAIRRLFRQLFTRFDEAQDTAIDRVSFVNDVVYITWWADFPDRSRRTYGTDTFVIRSGRIKTQTIARFD